MIVHFFQAHPWLLIPLALLLMSVKPISKRVQRFLKGGF